MNYDDKRESGRVLDFVLAVPLWGLGMAFGAVETLWLKLKQKKARN
jgi:hypothetical protein